MSEGSPVYAARVVATSEGPDGRVGRVSVRGAQLEVALDLVPEAGPGDNVLVHAGVALSLMRDGGETEREE
jgi:hydrogenase maturation factor